MFEFLTISLIIILAAISPGPDFAMVVKNALLYDRKSALLTALGISCSLIIHSAYAILGLAIIISKSLLLFNMIKYVGASYLIYIGFKSLFAKKIHSEIKDNPVHLTSINKSFLQGLFCNLLNPKAIMFILSFFTLIIKPSVTLKAQLGYGLEIAVIHLIWFSCLVLIITHKKMRIILNKIQFYVIKFMGILLISFGARIASLHYF